MGYGQDLETELIVLKRQGLTRRELARLADIDYVTLSNAITGAHDPWESTKEKIRKAINEWKKNHENDSHK